ncbi:hypothetical protein HCH_00499 [Hahella chejuensis KCTC 2396]|uniref:Uncharacterized protein n=1 Tax=Hahella chejuensis (strain KCTC 2396) TaxID=349521 RepID=Q2SPL9_HAHCH|nr:hypothetical protein HCH_00499 [Hahella chejuensis KCTC 2396]
MQINQWVDRTSVIKNGLLDAEMLAEFFTEMNIFTRAFN